MKPSAVFFYLASGLFVLFFYEARCGTNGISELCNSKGKASYYSNKFKGRKTSSGEKYHPDSFTCAHHHLPFGTILEVTNLGNGKAVKVKVNDRLGQSSKRKIDLSLAAARQLEMIKQGVIAVKIICTE